MRRRRVGGGSSWSDRCIGEQCGSRCSEPVPETDQESVGKGAVRYGTGRYRVSGRQKRRIISTIRSLSTAVRGPKGRRRRPRGQFATLLKPTHPPTSDCAVAAADAARHTSLLFATQFLGLVVLCPLLLLPCVLCFSFPAPPTARPHSRPSPAPSPWLYFLHPSRLCPKTTFRC